MGIATAAKDLIGFRAVLVEDHAAVVTGHDQIAVGSVENDAHFSVHQSFRFQAFERRQALDASGLSILLSKGTFKRLSDPGLTLDTKLAAVHKNKRLYFNSFFTARRIFDLASYYREATDTEIEQFAKEPTVALKTPTALTDNADEWVRRRIALIRRMTSRGLNGLVT